MGRQQDGNRGRILALDVGTSSVRALVADEQARLLPGLAARRPTDLMVAGDGRAELDPRAVLDLVAECIDELHDAAHLDGVAAVGVSCLWHALVGVDRDHTPLTPLFTWADTRAARAAARLRGRLGDPDGFQRRTGATPHNTYWTAKLAWLAERAGIRPHHWLGLSELLTARLLGDASASVSMASGTGLLDLARNTWDPEALDLASADPKELPPLAPPGWTGRLTAAGRRRWPALAGAVWAPVVGDGAAANLGTGCDRPGLAAVTIGTSAAIRVIGDGPEAPLPRTLWRYRVDHDRVITGAALSGGGNLYEWARETLDLPGPEALEAALARVPPGANGVTVLPFHSGARAPLDLTAGSGVVAGLSLTTTAVEVLAATLTATCFGLADGYEALARSFHDARATAPATGAAPDPRPRRPEAPSELLVIASGGALLASGWWQRTLANVLGRVVHVLPEKEASARGAALTALTATRGAGAPGRAGGGGAAAGVRPPYGARAVEPAAAAIEAEREARNRYETLLARLKYK